MADVKINYSTLRGLERKLSQILTELEDASDRTDDLIAAIGTPYGRTELRSKSQEFEERWEDKRAELRESLEKIHEHVETVIEGFEEGDLEMATGMDA